MYRLYLLRTPSWKLLLCSSSNSVQTACSTQVIERAPFLYACAWSLTYVSLHMTVYVEKLPYCWKPIRNYFKHFANQDVQTELEWEDHQFSHFPYVRGGGAGGLKHQHFSWWGAIMRSLTLLLVVHVHYSSTFYVSLCNCVWTYSLFFFHEYRKMKILW